jgi:NAD(P)-dependent dehydrogenase (short-subunit alcohol dehydrogenase family)
MSVLSIPSFTNVGYWLHSRSYDPIESDMSGKTVLITGGTGGLGRAAAADIAGLGARVVVIGRSRQKLEDVETALGGDVTGYQADLSLMSDVRALIDELAAREPRVDVLVNNVGVLLPDREVTSEGIEKTLATDLAGHFLLTNMLIPRLASSSPARIVNVTSGGMYSERIRPGDMQFERREYKGSVAYSHAKRGQVILTGMWAERLDGTGVTVNAMHPGWAKTPGVERSLPTFNAVMKPFLRTPDQGADTIVWLAAADRPSTTSGELWFDRRVAPKHLVDRTRESPADRQAMWDALVALTGSDMPDIVRPDA